MAVLVAAAGLSDRFVFARVAKGDLEAFRDLFDAVAPRALAIALRVLKDTAEAEEVVQETFIQVWKTADRFDAARGSAATWICTVARSRALDRLRTRSASTRAVATASAEPPPPQLLPLEEAVARQDRERVARALAELPAPQRQALELAYFEGLTQAEVAERTGEPLGTIKTRTRMALQKLSTLLGESGGRA